MQAAADHARAHHALPPLLSPDDDSLLNGSIPIAALQAAGIRIIPWTTNDPARIRAVLDTGVNGLITDYPDRVPPLPASFDLQGHRGARGLRPENTLPAFEAGLDHAITTLECDTGVTADGFSLIWHDQFLNPASCRHADGSPYTDRAYLQDITLEEAQRRFLCDKLRPPFAHTQQNDLALSPVAVAFAAQEGLPSPYSPIHAAQLFRFAAFYAGYYRTGPGRSHPAADQRAETAERVRFNLETKLVPGPENHTATPQAFVDALCGAIVRANLQARATVQSFDFRTLTLVQEQHPDIATVYLTEADTPLRP